VFEQVYAVFDFYDGPREGVANFRGKPVWFKCAWDVASDDWSENFDIILLDDRTFELAMCQWKLWCEWEKSFHGGLVSVGTHPAMEHGSTPYKEIEAQVAESVANLSLGRLKAKAEFRVVPGQAELPKGVARELEVEWRDVA
jgi:hypothetical protein